MKMWMIDKLRGRTRITVAEHQRVLVLERGRLTNILRAGEHRLGGWGAGLEVECHDLGTPELVSKYARALMRQRPDLAESHLTEVRADDGEVVVALRDGALYTVSRSPGEAVVLWTDAGPWEVRRYALGDRLEVPAELRRQIEAGGWAHVVHKTTVERGQVGLLTVGGTYMGVLAEGVHLHWDTGRAVQVRLIDTRWRAHDVTGQEVLTADRVTVRVNIAADVRVTDPVKAATAVKDHEEALHRALQLAFRKTVGARTLDQLLAEKVTVDAEAAEKVRAEMAEIGLEVGQIALKDVILPGEMRAILNRVVEAEKTAEANVIKRREETQATRSLLNTAKVMAEHPVMLRLKELEALTELAGKVDKLTVHNGTEGLMNDLVRLRE